MPKRSIKKEDSEDETEDNENINTEVNEEDLEQNDELDEDEEEVEEDEEDEKKLINDMENNTCAIDEVIDDDNEFFENNEGIEVSSEQGTEYLSKDRLHRLANTILENYETEQISISIGI